jgi:hypothetical protein
MLLKRLKCIKGIVFVFLIHFTYSKLLIYAVFPSEIIQPLFDMANPESEIYRALDHQMKTSGKNWGPETTK